MIKKLRVKIFKFIFSPEENRINLPHGVISPMETGIVFPQGASSQMFESKLQGVKFVQIKIILDIHALRTLEWYKNNLICTNFTPYNFDSNI
jgi:hypothetical protein